MPYLRQYMKVRVTEKLHVSMIWLERPYRYQGMENTISKYYIISDEQNYGIYDLYRKKKKKREKNLKKRKEKVFS